MEGKLGDRVSQFPLEKIVMSKGQKILGGIISKSIRIVKIHYGPGMGYFHCFEGPCCDAFGLPGVRYSFPWVQYNTDLRGDLIVPEEELTVAEMDFTKMLVMGKDDYENVLTKQSLLEKRGSDITKQDMLVSCTDAEYQKRDYDIAGDALWRKVIDKEYYKKVMKFFVKNSEISLGRFFKSEKDFQNAVDLAVAANPVVDRPRADQIGTENKKQKVPLVEQDVDISDMFEGSGDDDIPF